jgi:chromosome segregation ATPase
MNRALQYLNLLGVLALVILCGVQWQINGRQHDELDRSEKTRAAQAITILNQQITIKGCQADLDEFRQRLALAESQLKDAQQKLAQDAIQIHNLATERDQLRAAMDKWIAAVKERDAALKKALEDRNDAVAKFNDLAGKYNELVKDEK